MLQPLPSCLVTSVLVYNSNLKNHPMTPFYLPCPKAVWQVKGCHFFPLPWRWSQAIPSSLLCNSCSWLPDPPPDVTPRRLWALNNVAMLLKCIWNLQNTIYLHHQIATVLEESVIPPFAKDTPGSIVPAMYLRHHRLVLRLWAHHMHLQHQLGQTT